MKIEVASDKNPEILYQVDTEAGTCTCPHWTQKLSFLNERDGTSLVCKHVKAVREQERDGMNAVREVEADRTR